MKRSTDITLYITGIVLVTVSYFLAAFFFAAQGTVSVAGPGNITEILQEQSSTVLSLVLGLFYLFIFTAGVINGLRFILLRIKHRPLLPLSSPPHPFPGDIRQVLRALFWTACIYTLVNLSLVLFPVPGNPQRIILTAIACNLLMELAVPVILLSLFSSAVLGLQKKRFIPFTTWMIYTAWLVFLVPAAAFNQFLIELRGPAGAGMNPAVALLLSVKSNLSYLLLTVQVLIFAPLAEELFFRGFLFRWMRNKLSFNTAAVILSLVFAVIHRAPADILPLFMLSMLLCYLYERSGNLWNSILLHSTHNLLGSLVIFTLRNHSFM